MESNPLSDLDRLGLSKLSRRGLFGLGASVGAAALLSACSSDKGSTSTQSPSVAGQSPSVAGFEGVDQFTVADWGGTTDSAIRNVWGKRFTEATGIPVQSAAIDYGKLLGQSESQNVTWDWADVEGWYPYGHADTLEDIDYAAMDISADDLVDPALMQPNTIASYLYSFVIGYRTDSEGPHPTSWGEFFDTKAVPGKRALYNWPYGMIEIALLGDGVAMEDLYPLDVDRALGKIDSIRGDDLIFWNSGAESQQFLVSGAADFVVGWNPRFGVLILNGLPIGIEWNEHFRATSNHIIPKYVQSKEACQEFIKAALDPEAGAEFSLLAGGLGAPMKAADGFMDDKIRPLVSTTPENFALSIGAQDDTWWGENLDAVSTTWFEFVGG